MTDGPIYYYYVLLCESFPEEGVDKSMSTYLREQPTTYRRPAWQAKDFIWITCRDNSKAFSSARKAHPSMGDDQGSHITGALRTACGQLCGAHALIQVAWLGGEILRVA